LEPKLKMSGKTLIIRLEGELDHHTVASLRSRIDDRIVGGKAENILFNFQAVDFMDSSGLGMVLGRYKVVKERGGAGVSLCPTAFGVQGV